MSEKVKRKVTGGVMLLTDMDYDSLVESHFFTGTKKQINAAIDAVVEKWCYKYLNIDKEEEKDVKDDPVTYWEESDDKDEMSILLIKSVKVKDLSVKKE